MVSLIGVGVTPDHYVELGLTVVSYCWTRNDPQLQKAIEVVALNIALAKE